MSKDINITSLRKKGRYFYIAANKTDEIKFHPDICLECSLRKGAEFSQEEWDDIVYRNSYRQAWECILRLLSIRAHCERDLSNKLRQRKFNSKIISAIINECKRLEFIDDIKFAKEYIKELQDRGSGKKLIKSKLMAKGLPASVIDEKLSEMTTGEDELKAAKIAYRKKAPSLKKETDPRKKQEKLYRYMISKGFSYDIIQQIGEDSPSTTDIPVCD